MPFMGCLVAVKPSVGCYEVLKTQELASPQSASSSVFWLSQKSDKEMDFQKRSDKITGPRAVGLPGRLCTSYQKVPGFFKSPRSLRFKVTDHLSVQPTADPCHLHTLNHTHEINLGRSSLLGLDMSFGSCLYGHWFFQTLKEHLEKKQN